MRKRTLQKQRKKHGNKLQTAIEFIVTYGWAFIIIAIILFALFANGFFNPNNYAAQQCVFPSSLTCLSFFMGQNGQMSINLQQSSSASINITAIGCNQNGIVTNMQKPITPSNQVFLPIGANYTFNVQCYTSTNAYFANPGSLFAGTLIVNYTNEFTKLPETTFGKLNVKVTALAPASTTSTSTSSTSTSSTSITSTSTSTTSITSSTTSTSTSTSSTSTSTIVASLVQHNSALSGSSVTLSSPVVAGNTMVVILSLSYQNEAGAPGGYPILTQGISPSLTNIAYTELYYSGQDSCGSNPNCFMGEAVYDAVVTSGGSTDTISVSNANGWSIYSTYAYEVSGISYLNTNTVAATQSTTPSYVGSFTPATGSFVVAGISPGYITATSGSGFTSDTCGYQYCAEYANGWAAGSTQCNFGLDGANTNWAEACVSFPP